MSKLDQCQNRRTVKLLFTFFWGGGGWTEGERERKEEIGTESERDRGRERERKGEIGTQSEREREKGSER